MGKRWGTNHGIAVEDAGWKSRQARLNPGGGGEMLRNREEARRQSRFYGVKQTRGLKRADNNQD